MLIMEDNMELIKIINRKLTKLANLDIGIILEQCLLIAFILGLVQLRFSSYYIYHSTVGIFSAFIELGIFLVATNTYKICKNDFFMFLGIGYVFVGILELIYTLSYSYINIVSPLNIGTQFWVFVRAIEMATVLISTMFIFNKIKKPNYFLIVSIFLAILTFFLLGFMYFNAFPVLGSEGTELTKSIIAIEYIILLGFCISILIIYKARKLMDKSLFLYIQASLIFKVIHLICFTLLNSNNNTITLIGHISKVISFYLLYKGIIVIGIQKPFNMLINNLDKADSSLKEKEEQHIYMQEAMAKNEQCYDLIINNSSDGIIIQMEGKIIFANSTSARISGAKDISELLGKDISAFKHEDSIALGMERTKIVMENRTTLPFTEFKIRRLDGEIIDIESSVSYIIYRGKPAILTMFRDICSRKKIKTLENDIKESEQKLHKSNENNRFLMEFFSNISHEFKTPMNVLLGAIQLLQLHSDNELQNSFVEKLNKLLGVMKQNTYRLLRIVNNIIDLSKFDSGYLSLNMHNYNVVSVLENITISVVDYAKSRDIELIFDTDVEEKKWQ